MKKLHIAEGGDCNENHKSRNIFDELTAEAEKNLKK